MREDQNVTITKWKTTPVGRVGLGPDGIVIAEIKPNYEQTPEDARANLEAAIEMSGGKRRPLLTDLRGALPLGPKTRRVYTGKKVTDNFSAMALVIKTDPVSRYMANVYFHVAGLSMPTRIFSDIEKALAWLKSITEKN